MGGYGEESFAGVPICGGGGGGGGGSVVFILGMSRLFEVGGMMGQRAEDDRRRPLCPLAECKGKVGGTIIGDAKDLDNYLASHYCIPHCMHSTCSVPPLATGGI